MSAANLKLSHQDAYSFKYITLRTLTDMFHKKTLTPTNWQRWLRWKEKKDTSEWISEVLENTPLTPIFLWQSQDGHFHIIEGHNRTHTFWSFIYEDKISVFASSALKLAPEAKSSMKFSQFSEEQKNFILDKPIPICIYPPETSQETLRRAFRNLNKGRIITSYEIIHSWTHVDIVNRLINPLDEEMVPRIRKINCKWKPQHHRMNHTWIRITAMIINDNLFLGNKSEQIENWLYNQRSRAPLSEDEISNIKKLCHKVISIIEKWKAQGVSYSIAVLPDIAWAIHNNYNESMLTDVLLTALRNDHEQESKWRHNSKIYSYEQASDRRQFIKKILKPTDLTFETCRKMSDNRANNCSQEHAAADLLLSLNKGSSVNVPQDTGVSEWQFFMPIQNNNN